MNLAQCDHLESIRIYELKKVLSIISEEKKKIKDVKILEIGAGTGWQAKKLTENGYTVEAIDLNNSNYLKNRIWPITDYDGEHIPFPDNYFDILFSSSVLEHIPHLEKFQIEMQRVLKPDGIAVHIVPNGNWRFWTSIVHYPYIFKTLLSVIYSKTVSFFGKKIRRQYMSVDFNVIERYLK